MRHSYKTKFIFLLLFTILGAFNASSLVLFYVYFEASLIPIVILILGWGYQPERIFAGMRIILYTIIASLPLLVLCVVYPGIALSPQPFITINERALFRNQVSNFIMVRAILGFLAKLPIFGLHLWLPRAHVEAPVYGSIILASVILKLGGYGLFIMSPLLNPNRSIILLTQSIGLVGGLLISVLCLRQTDIKTLIAYSSVAHIGMALAASLTFKSMGGWSAAIAYISHGFVSSGLFMGANYLYSRFNSRNLLLIKSSLTVVPLFTLFWFILCVGNIGAPPSLNLVSEIFMISSLFSRDFFLSLPALLMAGVATAFTITLFILTQHSQFPSVNKSIVFLSPQEFSRLTFHSGPIIVGIILFTMIIYNNIYYYFLYKFNFKFSPRFSVFFIKL